MTAGRPRRRRRRVELDGRQHRRGGRDPRRRRSQAAHARASGWSLSASSPARAVSSRPTSGCGSAGASGSTRSATSTAAPSSPTWASTRPGSPPRTSSAARSTAIAEGIGSPRVTFTDPQVAAVGMTLDQARERRASTRVRSTSPPTAPPAPASRAREPAAPPASSSTRRARHRRRHLHRLRDRRLPPRRDRRNSRRSPSRPTPPRGRRLPDPQRDLAEAARGLRALASRRSSGASGRQDVLRETGNLIEVVDRAEATEPLAVGEQPGRLGDREVLGPRSCSKLTGVEVDRTP